jgi:hypothetical protein
VRVDTINILYKELFTILLQHDAYKVNYNLTIPPDPNLIISNSLICEDLSIEPDNDTKILFARHDMGYRSVNGEIICFIRSKLLTPPALEPKIPYVEFSENVRMRFLLLSSSSFLNKTDVKAAGSKKVYQFSNRFNIGTDLIITSEADGVGDADLEDIATTEVEENCFGVIDIYSRETINSNYEIFGTNDQLLSPVYTVRFKRRI